MTETEWDDLQALVGKGGAKNWDENIRMAQLIKKAQNEYAEAKRISDSYKSEYDSILAELQRYDASIDFTKMSDAAVADHMNRRSDVLRRLQSFNESVSSRTTGINNDFKLRSIFG